MAVLQIIAINIGILTFVYGRPIVEMDILSPYKNDHYDVKRTHRHVRSCVNVVQGNTTYESFKPKQDPVKEPYYYVEYLNPKINFNYEYAHRTVIFDPLRMLSVLEPSKPGSCKNHTRETVKTSSGQRHCIVAANAGFFRTKGPNEGECLGNLISDGKLVIDSKGVQNANFGIRQDGTIVVGYLSEEDVLQSKNPFVQLISGVGWILRKGELYLEESKRAECADTQETGSIQRFFNVRSARTLLGHDANGSVHLVQFDGKTDKRGVNLRGAANYLKSLGVINAINLDGGGSATYVINDTIVNYPSDVCDFEGHKRLCPRTVSSIICVHEPDECQVGHPCVDGNICVAGRCKSKKSKTGWPSWLANQCDRNYILLIAISAFAGLSVIFNLCLTNCYCVVRTQMKRITSGRQKSEALRNLLEQTDEAYDASDSEWDEEDERGLELRRLRRLDMIE